MRVVGNKETDTYHKPNCPFAKKIKPGNKVTFISEKAAIKAGYGRHNAKICMGK